MLVGFGTGGLAQGKVPKKAQKRLDAAIDLYMKRDAIGAAESVEEALAIYPDYPDAWMLQSQLLEGQNDWSGAAEALACDFIETRLVARWRIGWFGCITMPANTRCSFSDPRGHVRRHVLDACAPVRI